MYVDLPGIGLASLTIESLSPPATCPGMGPLQRPTGSSLDGA